MVDVRSWFMIKLVFPGWRIIKHVTHCKISIFSGWFVNELLNRMVDGRDDDSQLTGERSLPMKPGTCRNCRNCRLGMGPLKRNGTHIQRWPPSVAQIGGSTHHTRHVAHVPMDNAAAGSEMGPLENGFYASYRCVQPAAYTLWVVSRQTCEKGLGADQYGQIYIWYPHPETYLSYHFHDIYIWYHMFICRCRIPYAHVCANMGLANYRMISADR